MIKPFPVHDEQSAPDAAKDTLAKVKADFGMIPNLERVMASAPALLSSYAHCWGEFQSSSFNAIEQQVIYLTVNFENNCEYCVPWHSKLAEMANMSDEEIENLRLGRALTDAKLNALHQFTKTMVRTRGSIAPSDAEEFFAAGFSEQQALEVVLGVAIKVMSNYTNALAQTPLDSIMQPLRWKKPSLRHRE